MGIEFGVTFRQKNQKNLHFFLTCGFLVIKGLFLAVVVLDVDVVNVAVVDVGADVVVGGNVEG